MKIALIYPTANMGRPLNVATMATDPRGLTGSESTFVNYAVGLAALGHEVIAYANVTTDKTTHAGVTWRHDQAWEPSQADAFDAVVAFMSANPLINCHPKPLRIFNMQCGDFGGQPAGWENHIDLLCSLSHTHAKAMKPTTALPAEKWRVMYNGVDTEAFKPATKIPGRCIWASSHDRGLHHLLEIWPQVRAEVPHAELHIFYDVNGLQRFAAMGPTDVPFLAELQRRSVYTIEMMRRLENHGVFLGASISRERMQREMASAEVLAYPCDPVRFTETYGCTVVEAMSAGCVPVLCFADAFPELWESRGCPGVAWPYEERKDEYIERLIGALRHPDYWAGDLREKARDFAWPRLVKRLERCIETRGAEGLEVPVFEGEEPVDYIKYQPFFERAA